MIKPRSNKMNIESEMKDVSKSRLLVMHKENSLVYYLIRNDRLVSFYVENDNGVIPGAVYMAVVMNYNKASGGYFLKLSEKVKCYLPDNEIGEAPIVSGNLKRDKLCEGDVVCVYVKKEGYKEKLAQVSCRLFRCPDFKDNQELLESITNTASISVKYTRLYTGNTYLKDIITNNVMPEDTKIICDNTETMQLVNKQLLDLNKNLNMTVYEDASISMQSLYGLKTKFDNITNEKVWLSNGGSIVINPTEAMVVIDVNSGKQNGKNNREDNILCMNLEAVEEIVFQIGARNLSGIIIVDFINMKNKENVTILIDKLKSELTTLQPGGYFVDITKLGLAEITRTKIRPDIYELIRRNNKNILL